MIVIHIIKKQKKKTLNMTFSLNKRMSQMQQENKTTKQNQSKRAYPNTKTHEKNRIQFRKKRVS